MVNEKKEEKTTTTKAKTTASKAKATTTKAKTTVKKESEKTPAKSTKSKETVVKKEYTPRLKEKFLSQITPALIKEFGYNSIMQVPKMEKIVINVGVGDGAKNSKLIDETVKEISLITGQKPVVTRAKKSIATFKIREGMPIGCKVTLRGNRMYEFFDKLISIALPRVRDFQGVNPNSFDGRGNYTLGVKEQIIFSEINYDEVNVIRGMDVIIVTTANSDKEGFSLLKHLGMPFSGMEE